MKIKYEFATESVEIEVSDEWATILVDLDRQEYNNDQNETRRHCSLEAYGINHEELASDEDTLADLIREESADSVRAAMRKLKDSHRELLQAMFFDGVSNEEYAHRCGVAPAAISQRKKTALKKLKNFLKKP